MFFLRKKRQPEPVALELDEDIEITGNTAELSKSFSRGIGLGMAEYFFPSVDLENANEDDLNDYAQMGYDIFKIVMFGWRPPIILEEDESPEAFQAFQETPL